MTERAFVCSCGWRKAWDWWPDAEQHMADHWRAVERAVWWIEIDGQPTDRKPPRS